jgi:murein DD-endopeptidase MepM/ murein hydrolase activator NlpD
MRGGEVASIKSARGVARGRLAGALRATGVAALLAAGALLATAVPAAAHGPAAGGPADSAAASSTSDADADPAGEDGGPGDAVADGGPGDAEGDGGPDGEADGEPGGDPGDADEDVPTDEELEALAEEIEALREEASVASRRHETLRRQEAGQRAELLLLGERLSRERHQLRTVRTMIGRQASSQYRGGGGVTLAKLMLSETPEDFLNGASLIGRGELTARQLMERSREAERDLDANERRTAELRAGTAELVTRQRELRTEIEEKLEDAEERLEKLEKAKEAAERAAAEAAAAAAAEEQAGEEAKEAAKEAAERADETGECAVAVRHGKVLAKPAVTEEWTAPLKDYRLSAGYGSSGDRWAHNHTGQDFAIPEGTAVLAVGSGTVVATGCDDAFGHQVVIAHDNGYYSQYAHLSVIEVEPGQQVGVGRRIGLSGNTGNSSGPHLHFEIRLTPYLGSAIDPMPWLSDHGVQL